MFVALEKNQKTFQLVQKYIEYLGSDNSTCTKLDNNIEMEEIHHWLEEVSADSHDNIAIAQWIKANGKSFRDYLNTVKLIYLIWFCSGNHEEKMSWDEFCAIGDNLNVIKNSCLDSIY